MSITTTNTTARWYIRWLTALVGALIVTTLSTITTLDSEISALAPTDRELPLGKIKTIEQTFTITRPDLVGIAFPIRSDVQSAADLYIPLHLRYADGSPNDLVSERLLVQAAVGGVITVRFAPITGAHDSRIPTATLKLILNIPELQPDTGPIFTARENHQTQESLTLDGRILPNRTLVVTPIYQRRWADSLWPISAMARGKPGLLGWPPLYALLAYTYLLTLGVGIANLRRAFLCRNS